jgi:pimeloyl-ACP methyl ester carboxylesterase/class 3 adenylate cyclase
MYDRRGMGLSDPVPFPDPVDYDAEVADLVAVLDDAGVGRAVLVGFNEGAPIMLHAAATRPDRCERLVVFNGLARYEHGPDYPMGNEHGELGRIVSMLTEVWISGEGVYLLTPSRSGDDDFRSLFRRYGRAALRPGEVEAFFRALLHTDVTDDLSRITAPTLVLYRTGNQVISAEGARYVADHIPGARFVELPGEDHLFVSGDIDGLIDEIQEFVTGSRAAPEPTRVLATILLTDIVDSTAAAAGLGDHGWREVLDRHDALVRRQLRRFGGDEVKTTGDGFLATFADPVAAIECGRAIATDAPTIGIAVRTGIHTGLCEVLGTDVRGLAVHIAARVAAEAGSGEVLVSGTVHDVVAGAGLAFEDRGVHDLKGVPGEWRLYACTS